jgi:hypothetical protein
MPSLPPAHLILVTLQLVVLPAALAAAAVFAVILLAGGSRWAAPGAALALAAGTIIGNWYQQEEPALPWLPKGLPGNPEVARWHWLLWLGLAALVLGVLLRLPQVPALVRWLVMAAAAGFATWLLVPPDLLPEDLREKAAWLVAACAAVVFVEWALLEHLGERSPGGGIPLGLALTFFAAAAVLIYADTARFMDVALILGASLFGIAVAARQQADAGAVAPGVAVLLPGLLLNGKYTTFSEVPLTSFLLVALAPLALLPTLLPPFHRWEGIRRILLQLTFILIPLIVAVVLAMQTGPLVYE